MYRKQLQSYNTIKTKTIISVIQTAQLNNQHKTQTNKRTK